MSPAAASEALVVPRVRGATRDWLLAIAVSILCSIWLFQAYFRSRGQILTGDQGDNRFLASILEHWFLVYQGKAVWHSPDFFYPQPGVLGYSDPLWLFSLPYSLARMLGMDLYHAAQWSCISWRIVGSLATFFSLRYGLRFTLLPSLAGVALASCGAVFFLSLAHFQLLATAMLEVCIALLVAYALRPRALTLVAAALSFAGLIFTSFYVAYFAVLLAGMVALVRICMSPRASRILPLYVARRWRHLSLAGVAGLVGLVPSWMVYIPAAREHGMRDWGTVMQGVFPLAQSLDPRPVSDLWSTLLPEAWRGTVQFNGAAPLAIPYITLFACLATLAVSVRRWYTRRENLAAWMVAAASAVLVLTLSVVQIGDVVGWRLAFDWIPGASAIRAPLRAMLLVQLLVAVLVAYLLDRWCSAGRRLALVSAVLACLILLEQPSTRTVPGYLRAVERARLDGLPAPPAQCRSWAFKFTTLLQLTGQEDAMLLRFRFGIPTVNGYSGLRPQGWKMNFDNFDYERDLIQWAEQNGIAEGLCQLDVPLHRWETYNASSHSFVPAQGK